MTVKCKPFWDSRTSSFFYNGSSILISGAADGFSIMRLAFLLATVSKYYGEVIIFGIKLFSRNKQLSLL